MSLLKEINTDVQDLVRIAEDIEAYLAELDLAREDKKFSIAEELGDRNPDQSAGMRRARDFGAARDLAMGAAQEDPAERAARLAKPYVIVRMKDGSGYKGAKPEDVLHNHKGTRSSAIAHRDGEIWFDPKTQRQPDERERAALSRMNPALADAKVVVVDQL